MDASTFDPARKHLFYFRCARDGSKTLSFVDGSGNPKDVSDYEFIFRLKQRPQYDENVIELDNSDLVRPTDYTVRIDMTFFHHNLKCDEKGVFRIEFIIWM